MMCSQNFERNMTPSSARNSFISRLQEVVEGFTQFSEHLDSAVLDQPSISHRMDDVRSLSFEKRKEIYVNERIRDQKKWYASKAETNILRKNAWFIMIIAAQTLAVASSIYLIKFPSSNYNLISFFTTLSAASFAWLQLKQHQSLKQAYTTALMELNFIDDKSNLIATEEELAKFVLDSENAISREHTLWLAQKR